jgi:hypothetical protein
VNLRTGQNSTGHISLLSAIMAANARGGKNTIILPAGTIPADDFAIDDNLTIKGKSATATIINGNDETRGFDIEGGDVTISNLTIEGCIGDPEGGGDPQRRGQRQAFFSGDHEERGGRAIWRRCGRRRSRF